jgi:hypothetical protein
MSKTRRTFSVGEFCWCEFFGGARVEVHYVQVLEVFGVVGARVQIIGDRIVRVCQSQLYI